MLRVVSLGHETERGSGGSTEKVAEQAADCPQASLALKLTVTLPPQESGAMKDVRSVVSTSQPPAKENWLIQLSKLAWMLAWVRQVAKLTSAGQVTDRVGGCGTVKVALQFWACPQASVALKEMVTAPPQESGGEKVVRSVVSTSHPPAKANWLIQLSQALSMSSWEAHRGVVRSAGQLTVRVGGWGTVKVATQFWVCPQASDARKVMVTDPPQESGVAKVVRSVVSTSQPPAKAN